MNKKQVSFYLSEELLKKGLEKAEKELKTRVKPSNLFEFLIQKYVGILN